MAKRAITLEEQRKALEEQLADIEKKETELEEEKKRIIGDVVWKAMEKDTAFGKMIREKLQADLTKNSDRALFDLPKKARKASTKPKSQDK